MMTPEEIEREEAEFAERANRLNGELRLFDVINLGGDELDPNFQSPDIEIPELKEKVKRQPVVREISLKPTPKPTNKTTPLF